MEVEGKAGYDGGMEVEGGVERGGGAEQMNRWGDECGGKR